MKMIKLSLEICIPFAHTHTPAFTQTKKYYGTIHGKIITNCINATKVFQKEKLFLDTETFHVKYKRNQLNFHVITFLKTRIHTFTRWPVELHASLNFHTEYTCVYERTGASLCTNNFCCNLIVTLCRVRML